MTPAWKPITAGLLLVATWGAVGSATAPRPEAIENETLPASTLLPSATPALDQDRPDPAQEPAIRGRVLDPDGGPVAGATVQTGRPRGAMSPSLRATTDQDGRFTLPAAALSRPSLLGAGPPSLIASAPGFGKGWQEEARLDGEMVIKLVAAGPPIEGRLVDAAHQPVAGATVRLTEVWVPINIPATTEPANLTPALTMRDTPQSLHLGFHELAVTEPTVMTDVDGRFRLDDLGPERVAVLVANGPTMATTRIFVGTRVTMVASVDRHDQYTPIKLYPPRFERIVQPTQPITGIITDAGTGRPLAGWRVGGNTGWIGPNSQVYPATHPRDDDVLTISDGQGRYALTGLPPGQDRWVYFNPPRGQPFLPAGRRLKSPPEEEAGATTPLVSDLAAVRGVVVRGRVTDQRTGAPLDGHLIAGGMRANPYLKDHPGYASSRTETCSTDEDGRYEVVVPPGPGIVAFVAEDQAAYQPAIGADAIPGIVPPMMSKMSAAFQTVDRSIDPYRYNVLAGVDPPAIGEDLTVNLAADPWRTITLNVVGPDGQPMPDLLVNGTEDWAHSNTNRRDEATVKIRRLAVGKPRRVTVRQRERHLAGSIVLDAAANGDNLSGSATLKLAPWGEIRGRIVDLAGSPRPDLKIDDDLFFAADPVTGACRLPLLSNTSFAPLIGPQGEFDRVGLVPGLTYRATISERFLGGSFATLIDDFTVKPGERKELGTLKVRPPTARSHQFRP